VWADTKHPEHSQFTVAEMLELERDHLMSMPTPFDGYVEKCKPPQKLELQRREK
jgi:hypothetical protein